MLYQLGHTQRKKGSTITRAVKGSRFAVVRLPYDGKLIACIYYQDPELHLRARYRDHSDTSESNHGEWALGLQSTDISIHKQAFQRFRAGSSWGAIARGEPCEDAEDGQGGMGETGTGSQRVA